MTDKTTAERETPPAEKWLRDRYGAYRGHPSWRDLEEAFQAGRASLPGAQEAVAQATQAALETLERTYQSIARQLDLIAERAPGTYLDKQPVVNTLRMHQKRAETAAIALRSALAAAPQPALSAGWVSVDERLPEVVPGMSGCIEAIAHWDDGAIETSWFWRGGRWQHADGEMDYHRESKVTHWQPLPAPPIPASEAKGAINV